MCGDSSEKVWAVVRVRKGSALADDASAHSGFTNPGPAHLVCDLLNDEYSDSPDEFRVLEMSRSRLSQLPQLETS